LGLHADLVVANAADLPEATAGRGRSWVIFWAVLEHMTIDERLASLSSAWCHLEPGGLLTLVETPNRLWPFDSHTSLLPYFSWLPYELAHRYSGHSRRPGFRDRYVDGTGAGMEHFLRRGHGVSFHEFDLAIGQHGTLPVASYLQAYWRRRDPVRALSWPLSRAGRTERLLASYSPATDRAWFQPFLYLTLRKP
jgi:S-adenosylmethionine-dependent methyltransferase